MPIRAPKDFWSGVIFIAFAAVAMGAARGYSLGSAGHMGPGYFPMMLGIVLAFIGAILIARSLVIAGEPVGTLAVIPVMVITIGVILFGAMIEKLGLIIALVVITIFSALAARRVRIWETGLLAAVMAAFAVGVFVYALRLPIPVWPDF